MKAAPAPKAKPKAKPSGPKPPPPNRKGNTTPRGEEARKVAKMSASEKAKTPCMFYAYNAYNAKSCAFLHSDTNKYKGLLLEHLVKVVKPLPKLLLVWQLS